MKTPLRTLWMILVLLSSPMAVAGDGGVVPAGAADAAASEGTLSIVFENDTFYDADRHYTNGLRVVWVPGPQAPRPPWVANLADHLPLFPQGGRIRHGYAFGQSMFTPTDIHVANPPADDRPYAGWLYASLGLGVETGRQLDLVNVMVGVVGPASLAEPSQKFLHRVLAVSAPQGWDTQLGNEPGLVVSYQRSWRGVAGTTFSGSRVDITPHIGASLGNVLTYAAAGMTLRYGRDLPRDYGPSRIQPAGPGSGEFTPVQQISGYFFAGFEGRAMARNIFLDGNSFQESRQVDSEPLVADLQAGFVIDWQRFRFGYTHVRRTREFRTQYANDDFGAFSISFKH